MFRGQKFICLLLSGQKYVLRARCQFCRFIYLNFVCLCPPPRPPSFPCFVILLEWGKINNNSEQRINFFRHFFAQVVIDKHNLLTLLNGNCLIVFFTQEFSLKQNVMQEASKDVAGNFFFGVLKKKHFLPETKSVYLFYIPKIFQFTE